MLTMHDQAFILEDSVPDNCLGDLLGYALGSDVHQEALAKNFSGDSFYKFISLSHNSRPSSGLPEGVSKAVSACHEAVLKVLAENTTLPRLEEDYSGMSLCSNYSMVYHADAERPYCTGDRNLGTPETSGNGGFMMPTKNEWQPNHTPTRVYTTLVYLTDDFEGGETTMPVRGLDVKPKCGRMFGFPCSRDYIHGIRKNWGGVRIAFTAWYKLSNNSGGDPYGTSRPTCV